MSRCLMSATNCRCVLKQLLYPSILSVFLLGRYAPTLPYTQFLFFFLFLPNFFGALSYSLFSLYINPAMLMVIMGSRSRVGHTQKHTHPFSLFFSHPYHVALKNPTAYFSRMEVGQSEGGGRQQQPVRIQLCVTLQMSRQSSLVRFYCISAVSDSEACSW